MNGLSNPSFKDPTVVHRVCFAAKSLPVDCPNYWTLVSTFAAGKNVAHSILPEETRVFVENLKVISSEAFTSEDTMFKELVNLPKNKFDKKGVVLVSHRETCPKCTSKLKIRSDRVASAVIYDHSHGTIAALHYTKYCRKIGCNYNQHYGYHTVGNCSSIYYDSDCLEQPYFMASRETAFTMTYLRQFDVNCLIGQISYKQAADIYNYHNGYENLADSEYGYKH
jgi:hypothetical protein